MRRQLLTEKLKKGEIGVMPTDTIYGIVGSALRPSMGESEIQSRQHLLK